MIFFYSLTKKIGKKTKKLKKQRNYLIEKKEKISFIDSFFHGLMKKKTKIIKKIKETMKRRYRKEKKGKVLFYRFSVYCNERKRRKGRKKIKRKKTEEKLI